MLTSQQISRAQALLLDVARQRRRVAESQRDADSIREINEDAKEIEELAYGVASHWREACEMVRVANERLRAREGRDGLAL